MLKEFMSRHHLQEVIFRFFEPKVSFFMGGHPFFIENSPHFLNFINAKFGVFLIFPPVLHLDLYLAKFSCLQDF